MNTAAHITEQTLKMNNCSVDIPAPLFMSIITVHSL